MTEIEELRWLRDVINTVLKDARHQLTRDIADDCISDVDSVIREAVDEASE